MNDSTLAIGIDLGTTYSCIAYIDEFGKPVVVKNFEGDSTTPSVVCFQDGSNELVVGKEAKNNKAIEPENVVEFIKRSIGKKNREQFIGSESYKPEEISSYILKKIIKDASEKLGRPIEHAVITCPAYFGLNEIEATAQAGIIAGLKGYAGNDKPNIIPEPTAAAFFYGLQKARENEIILVYDLGGGTFDITLLAVEEGSVKAICIGGNDELGGKNWDDDLSNYCIAKAKDQGANPDEIYKDATLLGDLALKVEDAKKMLSAKDKTKIPMRLNSQNLVIELTQEKFEELTEGHLESTMALCKKMLEEAKTLGYPKFDRLLLVGGSTKMPQVRKRLEKEFPGIPIEFNEPDEAVAKGAALYAWKLMIDGKISEELFKLLGNKASGKSTEELSKENPEELKKATEKAAEKYGISSDEAFVISNTSVKNCTSKSFGVVVIDQNSNKEIITNLIFKNSTLPITVSEQFGTNEANQESVQLQIMENLLPDKKIEDLKFGKVIGNSILPLPRGLPKGSPIEVTFELDNSSLLKYTGKDLVSNKLIDGEIKTEALMSEEELKEAARRASSMIMT
jgi:molecular chaperone DnaK (HSP70)